MNRSSIQGRRVICFAMIICASMLANVKAGDWPSLRHDQRRSGFTTENLNVKFLAQKWKWQSPLPPVPAWPDAAKWDAYAMLEGLRSMRDYDPVLHPIVVGQRVFLPSNADDTVRCLDVTDGKPLWQYTAEAPIRIAPSYHQGVIYFGADDGMVYAVHAETGALVWRTRVVEEELGNPHTGSFFNDGRICSLAPIRSGVLLDTTAGTGIVSAGMFPWQPTWLCGLSLQTGEIQWKRNLGTGWTLEGAMLLSDQFIIAPQGRSEPLRFDRVTGEPKGMMSGGGGSFVLLTEDDRLFHGPGNKGGWLTESDTTAEVNDKGALDKIASFDQGLAIIVAGDTSYLLDDRRLAAFDREQGEFLWVQPCDCPHDLILAGEVLFAGGNDQVLAYSAVDGRVLWRGEVSGRAMGLAVASECLLVATDSGALHCFSAGPNELPPPELTFSDQLDFEPAAGPGGAIVAEDDPALLYRWVFQNNQAEPASESASEPARKQRPLTVRSLAASDHPARFPPGAMLVQQSREQAIWLDGRTDASIATDFRAAPHPEESLTIEATVRIDKPLQWGGLLSIMQDNGAYEKGWILGYRNDAFGFAINGQEGPDRLTWIIADEHKIEAERWFHVAATYDGTDMRLYVNGREVATSQEQRGKIDYPDHASLHLAAYKDDDEHFIATGMLHEIRLYHRALTGEEITRHAKLKHGQFSLPSLVTAGDSVQADKVRNGIPALVVPHRGPVLRFIEPGVAEVRWSTVTPQAGEITIVNGPAKINKFDQDKLKTEHRAVLRSLKPGSVTEYQLHFDQDGQRLSSMVYQCDTSFDYTRVLLAPAMEPLQEETRRVQSFLTKVPLDAPRGIAMIWGCQDEGRLAESLSRIAHHDVIAWESNPQHVARARQRLLDGGVYGRAVSLRQCASSGEIEVPDGSINLLIVEDESLRFELGLEAASSEPRNLMEHATNLLRTLQPGGTAWLPLVWTDSDAWDPAALRRLGVVPRMSLEKRGWQAFQRTAFAGSASWSHMYGTPGNMAYAGETLSGARQADDLRIAWAGRPGPRYQSDRGNRKPSPLAADGRLYLQGLQRLISLDAHNGSILWSLELPEVVRFNVPRDCSNWCVDEDFVYVAARDRCLVIKGATGTIERELSISAPDASAATRPDERLHWGYLAREGQWLIGSAVHPDASFTDFWGSEHWYDEKDGEHAKKVCSDFLFCQNPANGQTRWTYRNGLIVNPTITISNNRVHFVECRAPELIASESRRLDGSEFWKHLFLVTLDLESGAKLWETPAKPMEGTSALYLVAAGEKLLLQSSRDGTFAMYAIDAQTGSGLWRAKYDWESDHHGKHLSRPAVVEDTIYLRPLTINLVDGSVISEKFPEGHQCGTYTASRDALFLRAGNLSVWDRISGDATRWDRLRPDCWISTIPAEGMLLSPEGGGGCSCGGWIETSIGFAPKWRVP